MPVRNATMRADIRRAFIASRNQPAKSPSMTRAGISIRFKGRFPSALPIVNRLNLGER